MSKGKVTYIDEDSDDIELFQQFIDEKFDLTVLKIENDDEIDSIVEEILSGSPDAIVTDYLLSEKALVKFNGQELIEAIQVRNKHTPCILLTSHAPDAMGATHDARIVQSKSIPFGGRENADLQQLFLIQIKKLIEISRKTQEDAIEELEHLNAIPLEELSAIQRQRIIELDNFIDSHGYSSSPIPDEIKDDRNLSLLNELLTNIDKLIKGEK